MAEESEEEEGARVREVMKGWIYLTIHNPGEARPYTVHLPRNFFGRMEYKHPNESTTNIVGYGQTEIGAFSDALAQHPLRKKE